MFRKVSLLIFTIFMIGGGFLLSGAVVKRKDPIQKTQTDPVGYQDKIKEEAEGRKGPPVPALELFPKEGFLSGGAVEEKDRRQEDFFEEGEEGEYELLMEESGEAEGLTQRESPNEEFKIELERDDMWEKTLLLEEELDFFKEEPKTQHQGTKKLTTKGPRTRSATP